MTSSLSVAIPLLFLASCSQSPPPVIHAAAPETPRVKRQVRVTGTVEAIRSSKILVPQIWGQGGPMTLTKLIPNGSKVSEGDLVAVFDSTQQIDLARDAQAKFDDLGHQVEQKRAQNRADAEKRTSDLRQAEADLELQKGPVLSEIDRLKADVRLHIARTHVDSLTKSNVAHDQSDAASLRILELQRDRQKVSLERTQSNMAS